MVAEEDQLLVLFGEKKYEEVVAMGRKALKHDQVEARRDDDLMRRSLLLLKVGNTEDGATTKLEKQWWSDTVRAMIQGNLLRKIVSVPVPMDVALSGHESEICITGFKSFSDSGCAVVMRIGGAGGPDWNAVGFPTPGYIPASVLRGSYLDQWTNGRIFLKDSISSFICVWEQVNCGFEMKVTCETCQSYPLPMYEFPLWNVHPTSSVTSAESPLLDVFFGTDLVSATAHIALRGELDALGEKRKDGPAPKYHNIIDPNAAVVNDLWVPTEFEVTESPLVETIAMLERACENATHGNKLPQGFMKNALKMHRPALARAEIQSAIPDLDPHANSNLYLAVQDVMEAALPLLARMRNPALLLPGPLQAVVKAQRIVLKEGETYRGVWHEEGLRENVVAVALYYYRVSPTLVGGGMEIVSKLRSEIDDGRHNNFSIGGARDAIRSLPRIKVPVKEGTLLVFGNYSAVHRVLPMEARSGPGSRDFLAFFIIDQRTPLPMPRALGPLAERRQRRKKLLREQLQSRGRFGLDDGEVYSPGYMDYADIAWLSSGEAKDISPTARYEWWGDDKEFFRVSAKVSQMNMAPPVLHRGLSFLVEYEGSVAEYRADSRWVQHIIKQDDETRSVFVDTATSQYRSDAPSGEGVRNVVVFDEQEKWLSLGLHPEGHETGLTSTYG